MIAEMKAYQNWVTVDYLFMDRRQRNGRRWISDPTTAWITGWVWDYRSHPFATTITVPPK